MKIQHPLLGSEVTPIVTHGLDLTMNMSFVGRAFLGMLKTEKSLLKNIFFHVVHYMRLLGWAFLASLLFYLARSESPEVAKAQRIFLSIFQMGNLLGSP